MKYKEWQDINCKVCLLPKRRYNAGKYEASKDTRYVDENEKLFNGKTCPDCDRKKKAEHKRNKKRDHLQNNQQD